jgi:tRNA-dihydrouridine synthase
MLESEGADGIIVHPRTPDKIFSRPARWEWIAQIKDAVRIPVIGNGDVCTPADALEMIAQTGCDGVMVGRAAAGRPHIFRELTGLLLDQDPVPAPGPRAILEGLLAQLEPEMLLPKRVREFKTFCEYFALSLPVPHWFWGRLQGLRSGPELLARAREYFERHEGQ